MPTANRWTTRARWSLFTLWHARDERSLPFLPPDRILRLQERRLGAIVRHACRTVPRYRRATERLGLRPEDLRTAADLARLPLISGEDLHRDPASLSPATGDPPGGLLLRSTGTSGPAKLVRYDPAALFLVLAQGQRQREVLARFVGRRFGYREMEIARPGSISVQMRRFYEEHGWVPRGIDLQRRLVPHDRPFDLLLRDLEEFRPEVVRGYGSHLGAFFRWIVEEGKAVHSPRVLVYGADRMADADRDLIEGRLGVPVLSTYQADEVLRLGFQCEERRGFHLFIDSVAVRVVDREGREVGPGGTGELVVSNLTNRATVLLNYRLGDTVTLGRGTCPCGRTLPTIERIDGRSDDLLLLPDGRKLHSLAFLPGLKGVPGVAGVQVVQVGPGSFLLRAVLEAGADWSVAVTELEGSIRKWLSSAATVRLEQVKALPAEPGGKVRSVIRLFEGLPR